MPLHTHIRFLPVLVAAVVLWLLGAVWYSPVLFAKPWAALINLNVHPNADRKPNSLFIGMIASFVGDLLVSLVLAHVDLWSHAPNFGAGAFIGFLLWLGLIVGPHYPQGVYENRPPKLFLINAGYWFLGLLITGGMLAVWH